jgi:hypothetical protein
MANPNHPFASFSMECDQWRFLHVRSIDISPFMGSIKLPMPTLECKVVTSPLPKLKNQYFEVSSEVQATPPEFATQEPKRKKGVKKNFTLQDGMQEKPKPFKEVSIEVKEEELTRTSSKGE